MTLSKKHSRIHFAKNYFGIGIARTLDLNAMQSFKVTSSGAEDDQPRYKLELILNNGERITLLHWADGKDTGQLKARLEAERTTS